MAFNPEQQARMVNEHIDLGVQNLNPVDQPVNLMDAFMDKPTAGEGSKQFDQIGTLMSIQLYEDDDPTDNYAFGLLTYNAETSIEPLETVGAVLAMLKHCWVNLRANMEGYATRAGISYQTVRVPSQATTFNLPLELARRYSDPEMMTITGYLIMLLFKNINAVSYDQFFYKRMSAMKALARVPTTSPIVPLFRLAKAGHIRQVLGANNLFCRAVIQCLIDERTRDGEYSSFCDYILDIIAWTGMSAYRWVFECLMLNDSPIFFSSIVRAEVLALNDVITAMAKCRYPAFFPYFGALDDVSKLKRARFPIILSVARVIKQRTNAPTANQFVLPVSGDQLRLVEELANAHQMTVARRRETQPMKQARQLLCGPI
ncbi:uncharacterized protein LOC124838023 [Vigna umbellata]|uniref:uncharacterized protein LOC124838023 n=1 Tax=Vigna umbellata TaxID=87088 RepID=UPI001F5F41DA|nr:uncharacterized protein LOC124838023 [Vigna umbellata]